MRTIKRIYNNNIVLAVDSSGEEVIVTGAGVGYLTNKGQAVNEGRVERVFQMTGLVKSGAFRVLLELPYEVLQATTAVTAHLRRRHQITLTPAVEVALADHFTQALRRVEQGIPIYNSMLWETKMTYPTEFAIALEVLEVVHTELGTRLPLDEAGFVTLHLVNAGLCGDPGQALSLGQALHDVVEIVERDLGVPIEGSPPTVRFLTHVKFVIQRLTRHQTYAGGFVRLFEELRAENPASFACAVEISNYLESTFATTVTDEERLYLMLHLIRLRQDLLGTPPTTNPAATD